MLNDIDDLWRKDGNIVYNQHYADAVGLLTRKKVYEKSEVAAVIANHAAALEAERERVRVLERALKAEIRKDFFVHSQDEYGEEMDEVMVFRGDTLIRKVKGGRESGLKIMEDWIEWEARAALGEDTNA